MTKQIIVLGAGMVGVSTALALQERGYDVALVDRRAPGQETSYGNAGFIQREAVRPYAFPREWQTLRKVIAGSGNDVHYNLAATLKILPTLARYCHESAPVRYSRTIASYAALIQHSISEHEKLIEAANAGELVRKDGWLEAYRNSEKFDKTVKQANSIAAEHGLNVAFYDSQGLQRAEPALNNALAGAIHWLDTWTISDPGELVERYAALFQRNGGTILNCDADTLRFNNNGWQVHTSDGPITASDAVVCLGPWAAKLVEPLGYKIPLFIKRGYHRHYKSESGLKLPLLDAERGYALVPMKRGLRVTTGAEFAELGAPPTPVQLNAAEVFADELLRLGAPVESNPWVGARPCVADMLPLVGAAGRHRGLWFHFGHGHQGFTLGPTTSRLLADLITGSSPYIDPRPYDPRRFG